jgi:DNA-directed RNA polymerase subunit beta'
MKRTQDVAGRGTIVPDLTLGMDEVGIPDDMLWTMWEKFIIKRLVGQGYSAIQAQQMVKDKHPVAKEALMRETRERPIMVNRAPTLHRFNIIASYPRPVPGKTIRINPFMEKAMNADYDGDTMQVHSPVGIKAVEEAKGMTLSNMLFHDKAKKDLLVFPQHEAIMGVDHASTVDEGNKPVRFKTEAEAMKAYHEGKIRLGTRVAIGD